MQSTLKRARTNSLPELPRIKGELILQVFTHHTLRRGPDSEDNARLCALGSSVLDASVAIALFQMRPMEDVESMNKQREEILSEPNFENWVATYGLREKIRCHPEAVQSLSNPDETRNLFNAYIGAIYEESGMDAVLSWVRSLLKVPEPARSTSSSPAPTRIAQSQQQLPPPSYTPPSKKMKGVMSMAPSIPPPPLPSGQVPTAMFFGTQPSFSSASSPAFSRQPPPHMASKPFMFPAQSPVAFLPLFNQMCAQRRVTVNYPDEFMGPPHAGQWRTQCLVNGIPKGVGTGSSKQIAKEAAARQAYYAMGWT